MGKTIAVGKKWIAALDKSIDKRWILLARGERPNVGCALCSLANERYPDHEDDCRYCPVAKFTWRQGCAGTPYWDWVCARRPRGRTISSPEVIAFAKKELAFLRKVRRACRTRKGAKRA